MRIYIGRLAKLSKYESVRYLTSVDEQLADIMKNLDIMIDNADMYYGSGWGGIKRDLPSGGFVYSSDESTYICKAAINCKVIISRHN